MTMRRVLPLQSRYRLVPYQLRRVAVTRYGHRRASGSGSHVLPYGQGERTNDGHGETLDSAVTPRRRHQDEGRVSSGLLTPGESVTVGQDPDRVRAFVPRIGRIGRFANRARVASPRSQGVLALAVYLAVWVIGGVLPLVRHPAWPQLDQSSMDPNFYTWSMRWWPYAIAHGLNPLHTAQIGAPAGYGLAWVTTIPPLALLLSPITEAIGPVVSFNLLMVVSLPVTAWAAFLLCRRLTGLFWPALFGGAVYGFSDYEISHAGAGQPNLIFILLLPLIAYRALLRRRPQTRPRP